MVGSVDNSLNLVQSYINTSVCNMALSVLYVYTVFHLLDPWELFFVKLKFVKTSFLFASK